MSFELLEKYKSVIWNCQVCSVCQRGPWNPYPPKGPTSDRLCPEYEKFRTLTHSAMGRIQAARWLMEGKLEVSEYFVKVLYDCLLCGACSTVGCVVDKDHVPLFRDMRAEVVRIGKGPPRSFMVAADCIMKEGNRFGRPKSNRAEWAAGIGLPEKADLVYFAGCVASYRKPELAQSTAKVLARAGVNLMVLGEEESCCGNPLINSGQYDAFETVMKRNIEAFRNAGASQVVTSCGCCYNVLKVDYPRFAGTIDFEVIHISELLARLIDEGRLNPESSVNQKVTYHDPCHLARLGAKVIAEPRHVISSIEGIELVEMEGSGKDTQCCGHFPVELPELSLTTGSNRITDAQAVEAEAIVTACSFCHWNLTRAAKSTQAEIEVLDITQLIARSLGL